VEEEEEEEEEGSIFMRGCLLRQAAEREREMGWLAVD
jgi:hypothetical protein